MFLTSVGITIIYLNYMIAIPSYVWFSTPMMQSPAFGCTFLYCPLRGSSITSVPVSLQSSWLQCQPRSLSRTHIISAKSYVKQGEAAWAFSAGATTVIQTGGKCFFIHREALHRTQWVTHWFHYLRVKLWLRAKRWQHRHCLCCLLS